MTKQTSTKIGVRLLQNRRSSYGISAIVAISTIALVFLVQNCSARVTGQVPAPVQAPTTPASAKSPGKRVMDPAFANAGKNPGLEIWRIENFRPVTYSEKDFGKFYSGDSYIVLNTKKDKNNKFSWDVHFWLGSQTSQDEAGAAAILTVQLDDLLNDGPVQHREVQDHESSLFLSYFKNGIRYLDGGVGTGFKHVETNAAGEKRLFQVKGKKNVRVRQVNLSVSSMNKGDCFILDAGNDIYVYVGSGSKRVEKLKAISAANQIRDQDHNGRAKVNIIDEFSTDGDKQEFFDILGSGSPAEVPAESTAEEDGAFETADANSVTLYKVSDQAGSLKIDTIATKPIRQEMLDTKDCFILDTGSGIYVWVGKGSTKQEKTSGLSKAQEFIATKKYPAWTQVHRIVEGAESAPFKQYFATWRDGGMSHSRLIRSALGYDSDVDDSEIDMTQWDALKKSGGRAIGFMPDDAQNPFKEIIQFVYRPDLDEVQHGEVSMENVNTILGFGSYVYRYEYSNKYGESGTILYVWEGEKAPESTKVAALNYADDLSTQLNGAMVVRIVQGHEPRHFLKIFKGKLLSTITGAPTGPQLFRIRGTSQDDVRANEVKLDSISLASDDVFALILSDKYFIWIGLGASEFERTMAQERIAEFWPGKEMEVIEEGAEPDDFWEPLNGEGVYDRTVGNPGAPLLEPRLFHCRISRNGRIMVEEVSDFEQADLDVDDVMIIDGGDELYSWVGEGTTLQENKAAFQMAKEYIHKDPSHRDAENIPIVKLYQGHEPTCFKKMFPSWDKNYWKSVPSYDDIKKKLEEHNSQINNDVEN
ncbi:gelsolin isoform X2 [Condylostylus longicornis]|uniref:gelsolin isoform X2 n=1 Tax=Condylostylus longicornis TaxID=2530218 RepID=UPI00244E532F|nr:gelsolin isoform X2 [Condylostylus longicornis]